MTDGALVLAGGGLAGIAWETGVLLGIQELQPDAAKRIMEAPTALIGTSAGSAVAAQLAGGTPLQQLFDAQLTEETAELSVDIDLVEFGAMIADAMAGVTSPSEGFRHIGAIALAAHTAAPADRRAAIAARLPVQTWGERRLIITAVDAETGDLRIFDRDSGVDLVDAVGASCAVPGIWPVVEIQGDKYMDGGTRSIANADLAAGSDPVLIIVPALAESATGATLSRAELDSLAPARVHVIYADDASTAAFGLNPLDPAVRRPAALAGLEVGRRVAAQVAEFWG